MNSMAVAAVSKNSTTRMDPERIEMLENEADTKWNKFYEIHQNK